MLDDLNELRTFRAILAEGSLSAAARRLGVTLAVVSKRLSTLEGRAGVRLIHRSTRSLSPTEEGTRLLTDVVRALEAIEAAETRLAGRRDEPAGTLRVSAPVALGRRCVAPVLGQLAARHPRLAVALELDDRVADLVGEGLDVAIRIGALADSTAVMRRLADNRRILVASPAYLDRAGRPTTPGEAAGHAFLRYGAATEPWRLHGPDGATASLSAAARLRADDGDVVHGWALDGLGIMLKSEVDVASDLATGRLERVLPAWDGGKTPIVALYPSARHVPLKTRVLLDQLAAHLLAVMNEHRTAEASAVSGVGRPLISVSRGAWRERDRTCGARNHRGLSRGRVPGSAAEELPECGMQLGVAGEDTLARPAERATVEMTDDAASLADQERPGEPVRHVASVLPVGIHPTGRDVGELQRDGSHRSHDEDGARDRAEQRQCLTLLRFTDLHQRRNGGADDGRLKR